MTWPMCGAPTGQECPTCAEAGRTCYHDERDIAVIATARRIMEQDRELLQRLARKDLA